LDCGLDASRLTSVTPSRPAASSKKTDETCSVEMDPLILGTLLEHPRNMIPEDTRYMVHVAQRHRRSIATPLVSEGVPSAVYCI